jgi:hypothetical protein
VAPFLREVFADEGLDRNIRYQAGQALLGILGPEDKFDTELINFAAKEGFDKALVEQTRMAQFGCEVIRDEITSDREGMQHFQYYLEFKEDNTRFPLAREYAAFEEGRYSRHGFDPDSFGIGWLKEPTLLQVGWSTYSVGGGHYTANTVLLIEKAEESWREVFRHSGEGRYRGGWMSSHHVGTGFTYDDELLLTRTYSGHECLEQPAILGRPFVNNDGKTYYTLDYTETWVWPCEIDGDAVTILPGKHWIDLQYYQFLLIDVARWRAGLGQGESPESRIISDSVSENLDILRRLNPKLAESDEATGRVLLEDAYPPFIPFEGHMYSTNDT